jgi:hypothetical protein
MYQMKFVNLTPHAITVEGLGTIPASGIVARVGVTQRDVGARGGVRLRTSIKGSVEGMPAPAEGVTYIVSAMVLDALAGSRLTDVVAPDTGPDAIRENGQIVAVCGFVC